MIKLEALEYFTIKRFDEIENIVRKNKDKDIKGALFLGDTFECNKDLADYITNEIPNPVNRAVARIIEVIPELTKTSNAVEVKIELKEKPVKKTTTKRKITKK